MFSANASPSTASRSTQSALRAKIVRVNCSSKTQPQVSNWLNYSVAMSHRGFHGPSRANPRPTRKAGWLARLQGFEAGQLILPEEAHWLASFKSELLAFPSGRFDDQADALSQLINWHTRCNDDYDYTSLMAGPELIDLDTPYRESHSWDEQLSAWFGD